MCLSVKDKIREREKLIKMKERLRERKRSIQWVIEWEGFFFVFVFLFYFLFSMARCIEVCQYANQQMNLTPKWEKEKNLILRDGHTATLPARYVLAFG